MRASHLNIGSSESTCMRLEGENLNRVGLDLLLSPQIMAEGTCKSCMIDDSLKDGSVKKNEHKRNEEGTCKLCTTGHSVEENKRKGKSSNGTRQ